jgi:hypothetical protein
MPSLFKTEVRYKNIVPISGIYGWIPKGTLLSGREWIETLLFEVSENSFPKMFKQIVPHILFKDGDDNPPAAILDNNGQVVLSLCKVCGQAEVDLAESCPGDPAVANAVFLGTAIKKYQEIAAAIKVQEQNLALKKEQLAAKSELVMKLLGIEEGTVVERHSTDPTMSRILLFRGEVTNISSITGQAMVQAYYADGKAHYVRIWNGDMRYSKLTQSPEKREYITVENHHKYTIIPKPTLENG